MSPDSFFGDHEINLSASSDDQSAGRQRIISSADLLRRGATLLQEACPRCGGLQIRYQNRIYCLNEDDLSSLLLSSSPPGGAAPPQRQQQQLPEPHGQVASPEGGLRKILEEKLAEVSKQLASSQDPDEQAKLLELISKYVDTLDKLKRANA